MQLKKNILFPSLSDLVCIEKMHQLNVIATLVHLLHLTIVFFRIYLFHVKMKTSKNSFFRKLKLKILD